MDKWMICFSLACLVLSLFLILLSRCRTEKIMQRMEKMLEDAIDGSFQEEIFDEKRLSRIESRLSHYLAASEVSAKNLAEEKDKIKTLISDISHQTRTPVSNLLLYSELLLEEDLPDEVMDSVRQIRNQSEKLSFLITSLVKLSRLETGILTLNPAPHLLRSMLSDIFRQYQPVAKAKGLSFRVKSEHEEAVFDEKWTAEALGNIVDNAIKYTESGSVDISVKPYDLFVCIKVKDTGIGIKESESAKIFGRFYRSQEVKEEKGTGIGLFLARQIISAQGGYIKVSSRPGEGSEFFVYLPYEGENRYVSDISCRG